MSSVNGQIEVVKELLTNNANIEANKDLCTPLIGGMVS
jgi:ankyrin repeat protein